jgi:sec-independent protein translocase protein TatC
MPLIEHFRELRKRTIRASLAIGLGAIAGWLFYSRLITILAKPICSLPTAPTAGSRCGVLYIDGVLGPLNLHISVAIVAGVAISSPFWLYQLWAFIAPALHRREKRYAIGFISAGTPFFAGGIALAYWILPTAIRVLLGFTPSHLTNLIKFSDYLSFVLHLLLLFGFAFELPVILIALNFAGVLSARSILKPWRGAIFGITVFSATFVPTSDPFTMMLLAAPLWLFYLLAGGVAWRHDHRVERKRALADE